MSQRKKIVLIALNAVLLIILIVGAGRATYHYWKGSTETARNREFYADIADVVLRRLLGDEDAASGASSLSDDYLSWAATEVSNASRVIVCSPLIENLESFGDDRLELSAQGCEYDTFKSAVDGTKAGISILPSVSPPDHLVVIIVQVHCLNGTSQTFTVVHNLSEPDRKIEIGAIVE